MALPTAPLGQLPSMNMPYSVPRYEVTRGRDKVLTALLSAIAQGVGQNVVSNAMSRDYADKPAGFLSKLVQGPQMDANMYEREAGRKTTVEQAAAERALKQQLADADRQLGYAGITSRENEARAARELEKQLAGDRVNAGIKQMEYEGNLRRELTGKNLEGDLAKIDREATHRGKLTDRDRVQDFIYRTMLQDAEMKGRQDEIRLKAQLEKEALTGLMPQQQRGPAIDPTKLAAATRRDEVRPTVPTMSALADRGVDPKAAAAEYTAAIQAQKDFDARKAQGLDYETQLMVELEAAKTGQTPEQVLQRVLKQRQVLDSTLQQAQTTMPFMPY